jgi:hypothetical protein
MEERMTDRGMMPQQGLAHTGRMDDEDEEDMEKH